MNRALIMFIGIVVVCGLERSFTDGQTGISNLNFIFTANLAATLPGLLITFLVPYLIFRNRDRKPQGKKGWAVVFLATWFVCAIWGSLISGKAYLNLFGGMGSILIPLVVALLIAGLISKPKIS